MNLRWPESVEQNNCLLQDLLGHKPPWFNFEPYKGETYNLGKEQPSYGFLNSQNDILGDTHQGICGPQLDMHKFDGIDPIGWILQVEHFLFLHHINSNTKKYQVALLYLDAEH